MNIVLLIIITILFFAYYVFDVKLQNITLLLLSIFFICTFLKNESLILFPFCFILYVLGYFLSKKPAPKHLIVASLLIGCLLLVIREQDWFTRSIISFFFLNSVAFLYLCTKQAKVPSLIESGLHILYFPKIICGPYENIERFLNVLKQRRHFSIISVGKGLLFILLGFLERYAFAGNLSSIRKGLIIDSSHISIIDYLFSGLLFGFELFFIISAFTSWAKGSSMIFGIPISDNFRFPFLSNSVSDFWRRWHISVHNWLKEFIYDPLRAKTNSLLLCILFTFLISAIWHKVTLEYLTWGILASSFILLEKKYKFIKNKFLGVFWVLLATSLLWNFFQINNLQTMFESHIQFSSLINGAFSTLICSGILTFLLSLFCDLQNILIEKKFYLFLGPLITIDILILILLWPNRISFNPIYGF